MKNLQRLLIAAAFASMIPSTIVLCSEESTKSVTATYPTPAPLNFLKLLAAVTTGQLGVFGTIAGAQGSHALKKVRRTLTKATNLTPETLVQLNKGIKGNRIIMATSLIAAASSVAATPYCIKSIQSDIAKEISKETV